MEEKDRFTEYLKIAKGISYKFDREHRDDLVQESALIYQDLVDKFDDTLPVPFLAYVYKPILYCQINYMKTFRQHLSLDNQLNSNDDAVMTFGDMIEDEDRWDEQFVKRDLIEYHLNKMDESDKEILLAWVNCDMTKKEFKEKHGIGQTKMDRIIKERVIAHKGKGKPQYKTCHAHTAEDYLDMYPTEVRMISEGSNNHTIYLTTDTVPNTLNRIRKVMETGELYWKKK